MATTPSFVGAPNVGVQQILPADTTAWKTLFTAGASGSKVAALNLQSTDTVARVVQVSILRSAVNYILGCINVPAGAGNDGVTPAVDALLATLVPGVPLDNDGQHYLLLKSGDVLQISTQVTLTAAKAINAVAIGGDF